MLVNVLVKIWGVVSKKDKYWWDEAS